MPHLLGVRALRRMGGNWGGTPLVHDHYPWLEQDGERWKSAAWNNGRCAAGWALPTRNEKNITAVVGIEHMTLARETRNIRT